MQRDVQPEWLDELPATDARAMRSRRDLRRVNAWMRNAAIVARQLADAQAGTVVELGAGDGTFLLAVARRSPVTAHATLVDRQRLLTPQTISEFGKLGWSVTAVEADVFDWLASAGAADVMIANLFLHHFRAEQLRELFRLSAQRVQTVVACEPRRSRAGLTAVRLLPLIGCNAVTRHDARISVRAGFAGQELSQLWPDTKNWELREGPANWSSHLFQARRTA